MSDDGRELLERLLREAARDGALEPERLPALARGLVQRAERLLKQRLDAVVEERDWLRGDAEAKEAEIAGLGRERAWLKQTLAQRDEEQRWLEDLLRAAEQAAEAERRALREERDAERDEHAKATDAHDRLLAHHRDVLARTAGEARAVAGRMGWWQVLGRRRLLALAEALESQLPEAGPTDR